MRVVSDFEERDDDAGADPGQGRARGRTVNPLFPDAMGPADGVDQLPAGNSV